MSPTASLITMGSSGSPKCLRSSSVICPRHSVNLAPKLPELVDNKASASVSTNAKPDHQRPFLFSDLFKPPFMSATENSPEDISILSDPAAAEKVLLDLLGPADVSLMQAYADGELRRNLAHHALASSLHLAMWLKETADISKQRDEAIAHVAELEGRVRRFEKIFVKQEAENELLNLEVEDYCAEKEEYESKIESLSYELHQQKQATEVMENKCKELEAMHMEKVTLLEMAMKQLYDANMLLAEVSAGLGVAREPEAKDPKHFWTVCIHCKFQYQYFRIYQNRRVLCPNCENAFLAIETISPPKKKYPWSSSSRQKPEEYAQGAGAMKLEAEEGQEE